MKCTDHLPKQVWIKGSQILCPRMLPNQPLADPTRESNAAHVSKQNTLADESTQGGKGPQLITNGRTAKNPG